MKEQDNRYLTINGQKVEVDEETYIAHYQMQRREKYEYERDANNGLTSYNAFDNDKRSGESSIRDSNIISLEEALLTKELHDLLHRSIQALPRQERELIKALYFDKLSERKYAKFLGLDHGTIRYRKKKTLSRLKRIMNYLGSFLFFFATLGGNSA